MSTTHSTPTAAKAQRTKPAQAAVCVSATVNRKKEKRSQNTQPSEIKTHPPTHDFSNGIHIFVSLNCLNMKNMVKDYIHTNLEETSVVEEPQLDLYEPLPTIEQIQLNGDSKKDIWDKSVKVEENGYYWNKKPEFFKASNLHTTNKVVVEFFCGCGGTSLGFEMAGFEVILGVDIHQPSIKTFKTNHPKCSTILGDIKKINPQEVLDFLEGREIDVLIGGVPCQGFSLNNRKRNEDDERNLLYKEFVKFVKILKPKAVVLENVSGMRSAKNGEVVKNIERDLSEAGDMTVKSQMLFAPDYGVPQKRQRLIFIGIKDKVFNFNDIEKHIALKIM
ncbi:MAG: DNA cytosine methyltransferase [Saprospiraceae bacterium]|nr:DNA cytosine methyltransferase [Saprospiraceae bacterium]